jgi:hypothetical protein
MIPLPISDSKCIEIGAMPVEVILETARKRALKNDSDPSRKTPGIFNKINPRKILNKKADRINKNE